MAIFGSISNFLNRYVLGFALGTAAGRALEPFAQELTNEAWLTNQVRPLDVFVLGQGVAQGQIERGWATDWANRQGISGDAFGKLVAAMDTGPGASVALDLWRRGLIDRAGFDRALKRAALEPEWIEALHGVHDHLLSPSELANGRQQGFVDVTRQHTEAGLQGITPDRADIQFELSGLPPGPAELAFAANRGFISRGEFEQGVREGHTKTKYTDLLWRMKAAVLSPTEAASARLRTWLTKEEADAIGAQHGYTPEQMQLLFLNRGRPASPTQMWTAAARKVKGPRGVTTSYEDHAKAIAISDIRPEYAELLWGIRFAYPSLFQLGRFVQAGVIDPATAELWASYNRFGPDVLAPMRAYWETTWPGASGSGHKLKALTETELRSEYEGGFLTVEQLAEGLGKLGYSADEIVLLQHLGDAARVKSYRDKVLEALHKAYVNHAIADSVAGATMTAEQISDEAQAALLRLWALERDFARVTLTAAQIRAAYRKNVLTETDALAELVERGYSAADAATYLHG